ncbi:MAG: L-ribulose-5-phosphate 4-epimerase AraD [Terrimicrobiaceae bacterium]
MSAPGFDALREECCEANRDLAAAGLIDLTFGNISVLSEDLSVFAIKPSGVPYEALTPADIVVLNLGGEVVWGDKRPSSDTPTHRRLLAAFSSSGIRAVAHTHSRSATAFAQAGVPLTDFGTTHADYFRGPVPVTRSLTPEEVSGDYEWETGKMILESVDHQSPADVPAILVRNHGPFVWASSGKKAVEVAMALEIVAELAIKTLALNPVAPPLPRYLAEKHFLRKHGSTAYYGQPS